MRTSTGTSTPDTIGEPLLLVVVATGMLLVEAPGALQGLWLAGLVLGWLWERRQSAPAVEQIQP